MEHRGVAHVANLRAGEPHSQRHALCQPRHILAVGGGVVVLRLDRARQRGQCCREGALEIVDQLRAVHGAAEAGDDRLDEHRVGLVERLRLDRLDVQHSPHAAVDDDRHAQLRARVRLRVARDVVAVLARVRHERGGARACHPSVDALGDRLLDEQKLRHHVRERASAGHQAQHAVVVQSLDRGEVERERAVQLVDHELGHVVDAAHRRQPRREPPRNAQLRAQIGQLAGTRHLLGALIGAMQAQRLGASRALTATGVGVRA